MNKRLIAVTVSIIILLMAGLQLKSVLQSDETFSNATIRYGSQGADVRELQGRLKFLGYYNGTVDGDFGSATLTSVKRFQTAFGLKADGVVGAKTKLKLWEATKKWAPSAADNPTPAPTGQQQQQQQPQAGVGAAQSKLYTTNQMGLSEQDKKLMANAVYGEARGEPYEGQVAVAAVILNRIKSEAFPNNVSGVIFQPGAFTAVADGQIWLTPNESAAKAVNDAINGWDPSGGCLYYFNPVTATSKWIWTRTQIKTIGKHIFCM